MDQSGYESDRIKNCIIKSEVPEICKTEPCCLGIDEAGRGPVLGPMVYGIAYCPLSRQEKLKEMGLADSKTLSEEQRESMLEKMKAASDSVGWIVEILTPAYISNSMLRRTKYNLNALSHDSAIGLLQRALSLGANITEVYVDTVGDPAKYQAKLKDIFPDIDITVAKKADATYPIVSGASICAKVARDQAVKSWQFREGVEREGLEYGSGYPADPGTKKFLAGNMDPVFGFPDFVRFSWSTASQLIEKDCVQVRWEDDDEDETKNTGSASLLSFFKKKTEDPRQQKHRFFSDRHLTQVGAL
ncbi:ribonuclease H2 subunit A-like [Haliotis rufescens]|uniref:ribonuclease H2 subunit A-like n=1 Tax=Haliotis rufescens TaxID=6454 RepID=UPI00201FA282|nr:ribonuclease H2 subunit A-like [Haliotis rufescens]